MAAPIEELRVPGLEGVAKVEKVSPEESRISFSSAGGKLNRDLVVYYRLAQNLPGRIEVTPFRDDPSKPGSFMMVLTPSDDVGPIVGGADYTFILDRSGSMQGKLPTLVKGVRDAIGQLKSQDRFRVVVFNDSAQVLTSGFEPATPDGVQRALDSIDRITAAGGTNMYEGVRVGLSGLEADRVQSVILVTDGVTNTGVIDPAEFEKLLQGTDVRIFGFLLGNSANWPLMQLICDESGGFYAAVSNADDIVGQLLLAKAKITSEALHDLDIKISGGDVSELTEGVRKKLYRGEQVVVFGRYGKATPMNVTMKARISGVEKVYTTTFSLPENEVGHPEIERLWAMNRIEDIERAIARGVHDKAEGGSQIVALGTEYQLVTDETSMVVLNDAGFARHGIDRKNQARVFREETAQSARSASPVYQPRVDTQQPAFVGNPSYHIARGGGGGGGAIPAPLALIVAVIIVGLRRRQGRSE
jgi:Ca-activated chloride channel family protein